MESFRNNLSPVEIKKFLTTVRDLTADLLIFYCFKVTVQCPKCGHPEICQSGAVSVYSSRFDKVTHEITACLNCGDKKLSTVLTMETL
jgi:hypothetical protein